MILQHDFILGQRAGFIGAQNVHRAEVLNGIQMFDDHFLLGQFHRAACQRRSDNHRQHFRRQAYGDGERKQRRFPPVTFGITVNEQHHWCHHQHKANQQHTDATDTLLERVLLAFLFADAPRQLTKPGMGAGGDNHRLRRAAHHVSAHKAQGIALKRVALAGVAGVRHFLHWQRFAG